MGSHTIPSIDTRRALDALRRVVQLLRESSRAAQARIGLSGAQLFVLSKLHHQKGISLNQLAQLTATHQSSVSVVVSRLVDDGLVARRPAPGDGRRLELSLTPSGRRLANKAPDAAQERLFAAIEMLPLRERRQLARALTRIVDIMQPDQRPPSMLFEDPPGARRVRSRS